MRAHTRLLWWQTRRALLRAAAFLVIFVSCAWSYLQLDRRTLAGLRVAGQPIARTSDPRSVLEQRARAWDETKLRLDTSTHALTLRRLDLGASLPVDAMARQLLALGRSGNPLTDLVNAVRARRSQLDLPWYPSVDREYLGRCVRTLRNRMERLPVAGTRDDAGTALRGVDGLTLDVFAVTDQLERALRAGELSIHIPMRRVPAPSALAIGTPDGIDDGESDGPAATSGSGTPELNSARMRAAAPREWSPSYGCEPMDPPYERFCQGPRQVPLPSGTAAELAEQLGLGTSETVGRLLNASPRADWVAAAGGPRERGADLLWPVRAGRLWRRFGYVRKPPFEHLLHRGLDIGAPAGAALQATADGIVAYSDNLVRGYGNLLVIIHGDAAVSFSAHCRAIYVFAGQRVRRGQVVAEVGDTGLARGSHVHWEYHVNGAPVDPDGLFAQD